MAAAINSLQDLLNTALSKLRNKDSKGVFHFPVPDTVPNYRNIIARPMDFSTMQQKIDSGVYTGLAELWADADLAFENCMRFNPPGSLWYNAAQELQRFKDRRAVPELNRLAQDLERRVAESSSSRAKNAGETFQTPAPRRQKKRSAAAGLLSPASGSGSGSGPGGGGPNGFGSAYSASGGGAQASAAGSGSNSGSGSGSANGGPASAAGAAGAGAKRQKQAAQAQAGAPPLPGAAGSGSAQKNGVISAAATGGAPGVAGYVPGYSGMTKGGLGSPQGGAQCSPNPGGAPPPPPRFDPAWAGQQDPPEVQSSMPLEPGEHYWTAPQLTGVLSTNADRLRQWLGDHRSAHQLGWLPTPLVGGVSQPPAGSVGGAPKKVVRALAVSLSSLGGSGAALGDLVELTGGGDALYATQLQPRPVNYGQFRPGLHPARDLAEYGSEVLVEADLPPPGRLADAVEGYGDPGRVSGTRLYRGGLRQFLGHPTRSQPPAGRAELRRKLGLPVSDDSSSSGDSLDPEEHAGLGGVAGDGVPKAHEPVAGRPHGVSGSGPPAQTQSPSPTQNSSSPSPTQNNQSPTQTQSSSPTHASATTASAPGVSPTSSVSTVSSPTPVSAPHPGKPGPGNPPVQLENPNQARNTLNSARPGHGPDAASLSGRSSSPGSQTSNFASDPAQTSSPGSAETGSTPRAAAIPGSEVWLDLPNQSLFAERLRPLEAAAALRREQLQLRARMLAEYQAQENAERARLVETALRRKQWLQRRGLPSLDEASAEEELRRQRILQSQNAFLDLPRSDYYSPPGELVEMLNHFRPLFTAGVPFGITAAQYRALGDLAVVHGFDFHTYIAEGLEERERIAVAEAEALRLQEQEQQEQQELLRQQQLQQMQQQQQQQRQQQQHVEQQQQRQQQQ